MWTSHCPSAVENANRSSLTAHAPLEYDRVNQPVHIHGSTSDRYSWLRLKKVACGQWSKAAAYVYESDAALGKK